MQRIVLFSEVNILIICWLISVCVCTVEGSQGILMMSLANYCFVEADQIPHYLHMSNCMLIFEFDVFALEHCRDAFSTVVDNDKPQLTSPSTENIEASASVRAVEDEGALSHYLRGEAPNTLPTPSIDPNAPDVAVNPLNPSNDGVPGSHPTGGVGATLAHDSTHAIVKDTQELKSADTHKLPSFELTADQLKFLEQYVTVVLFAKEQKKLPAFAQLLAELETFEGEKKAMLLARAQKMNDHFLANQERKSKITVSFPYTLFKLLDEKNVFHEIVLDDAKLKVMTAVPNMNLECFKYPLAHYVAINFKAIIESYLYILKMQIWAKVTT
ncbi:hypothetical protein Plhal703r1_c64g0168101 [Plasmopara halstedii]